MASAMLIHRGAPLVPNRFRILFHEPIAHLPDRHASICSREPLTAEGSWVGQYSASIAMVRVISSAR